MAGLKAEDTPSGVKSTGSKVSDAFPVERRFRDLAMIARGDRGLGTGCRGQP